MDSCDISTPFFDICLHFSALLVLVIFCNLCIRELVFRRSESTTFNTCSTCVERFVSAVVFHKIFVDCSCISGLHLALFFHRKKTFPETDSTNRLSYMKMSDYEHVRRLPERPRSNWFPLHGFQQTVRICCLNWPPLDMFQKDVRTMSRINVKSTLLVI